MFKLDEFLRVYKDIDLPEGRKARVRTLSDIEMSARQDYMLAEATRLTNLLRDPGSSEHKARIASLSDMTDDALLKTLGEGRRLDLMREAIDLYRVDFFPFPENATDQEKVDTLQRQTEHEKMMAELRAKYIVDGVETFLKDKRELGHDLLVSNTQERAVELYVIGASRDAETYFTIYSAVENLDGTKLFKDPGVVGKLGSRAINYFVARYKEVDSIDPWSLTKSESERAADDMGENYAD